tara:strand:+ start:16003 stop:17283 length:1281 start_codon:yes stop_codon:yes gene_type:complete
VTNYQPGDDFATKPVPEINRVSAYKIAIIIIGGTIAVPGFLMSSQISSGAGFYPGLVSYVLGCQVLAITGILAGIVGAKSKLSTYLILGYSFGKKGSKIANTLIALVMFFWFSILCNLFGQAVHEIILIVMNLNISKQLFALMGGLVMLLIALYGFSALGKMAAVMIPVLFLILSYGAISALINGELTRLNEPGTGQLGIGAATSIVIGAYSGGIVTLPDYLRYAKNLRSALVSVYIALGISFPTVLTITAIPSVLSGEQDLIKIMLSMGVGFSALIVLIFSTMSSNVGMIYSVGLAISASFNQIKFWQAVGLVGGFATLLSIFDVVSLFIPYISILGISIPSLCGIYICDFFIINKRDYSTEKMHVLPNYNYSAFISWGVGFLVGGLSNKGLISLTNVSAFDSMMAAAICYCLIYLMRQKQFVAK